MVCYMMVLRIGKSESIRKRVVAEIRLQDRPLSASHVWVGPVSSYFFLAGVELCSKAVVGLLSPTFLLARSSAEPFPCEPEQQGRNPDGDYQIW